MKKVIIITSSDSSYRGERTDLSGPVIAKMVKEQGWDVVDSMILPDEQEMLKEAMVKIADQGMADLILTTGGTGFSKRDCMPEAMIDASERLVPGIPEAMRMYSMQFTKRAMLSRAAAGIRKGTLIINLPGSPKAVRECLEYIISEFEHGMDILSGDATNCARK